MLTRDQLRMIMPRARQDVIDAWTDPLIAEMQASEITTPAREAAFLASVANETGGLTVFQEATYIGTPHSRIRQIFGSRAPSAEQLAQWKASGKQLDFDKAFFNWIYDDRHGATLGNKSDGDGYKYRGLGPGQLTGRGNFTWMAAETGLPLVDNPELLLVPANGAKVCAHFWRKNGCNAMVSDGSEAGFLKAMRKLNFGLQDFSPHLNYWHTAQAALAGTNGSDGATEAFESRRSTVRLLQAALLASGFDPKGVDGIAGPNTRAALKAFEEAHGLPGDGIVDADVLRKLGIAA